MSHHAIDADGRDGVPAVTDSHGGGIGLPSTMSGSCSFLRLLFPAV